MTKTYWVVGAVIVVLLVGGAALAFKNQVKNLLTLPSPSPVEQSMPAAQTPPVVEKEVVVEVDYTDSGFSPASVTVKKGTTVKFVNKTSDKMSVASNPHPTHTDYPGFDQYKSGQAGQSEYDFAFDKVGTWGYHNHFNPSDTGTVIVTE